MRAILSVVLLAAGLTACDYNGERDYPRGPAQTTVIERPDSTVIVTEPSQGKPLRLCHGQPC